MVERHVYKGTKEWVYTKEDDKRIENEDTDSTRKFKKGYKEWISKKQEKEYCPRFVRPKRVVIQKPTPERQERAKEEIVHKHEKEPAKVPEKYKREVIGKRPEEESKQSVKQSPIKWIVGLILLVIILVLLIKNYPSKPLDCEDGTLHDACSTKRPYYCNNGKLIENLTLCGCIEGERIFDNKCIPIIKCIDGTLHPECSKDKPYQCLNGKLIIKASICGCHEGRYVKGDYCKKTTTKKIDEVPLYKAKEIEEQSSLNETLNKLKSKLAEIKQRVVPIIKETGNEIKETIKEEVEEMSLEIQGRYKESCQKAFEYINELRKSEGIYTIQWSDELYDVALLRAKDMYERDYFSHYTPEGYDVGHYLGYTMGYSENIAQGYYTCSEAVDGWIDSPGHHRNLLFGAYGAIAQYSGTYVYVSVG